GAARARIRGNRGREPRGFAAARRRARQRGRVVRATALSLDTAAAAPDGGAPRHQAHGDRIMTRTLLVAFVLGSIVSVAAYSGARALNPGLLDALECVVEGCAPAANEPAAPLERALEREIDRY